MKRLWNWIHYRYALLHISKTPPKRKHSTWTEARAKAADRSAEARVLNERSKINRAWRM